MKEQIDSDDEFTQEEIDELLAWLATVSIYDIKKLKEIWESIDNPSGTVQ